jgi:hypothetical protein
MRRKKQYITEKIRFFLGKNRKRNPGRQKKRKKTGT